MERFDVVIVGGRCAGSSLATHLAGAGLSVCLLEKGILPSDALSTHIFQRLDCFERLGVMDALQATGAPLVRRVAANADDVDFSASLAEPWMCVRRPVLDTILVERAAAAGADVRTGARVTELVERDGRVEGVRYEIDGSPREAAARLVVGADGMRSTVGRLTGARRYNLAPGERFCFWGYWEGTRAEPEPAMHLHRFGSSFVLACPADAGILLVIAAGSREQEPAFLADVDASYDAYVRSCPPVAAMLDGARLIQPLSRVRRWTGFFRESAGPGWVLVGDAGHFKDPGPGQGISDALRQAEALVPAICGGLDAGDLDQRLSAWWRWRDADAYEMHWFALDINSAGPVPLPMQEVFRHLQAKPQRLDEFWRLFSHRGAPSKVLTPPRLMAAAAKLLVSGRQPRGLTVRQVKTVVAEDRRRRRLAKRPQWEDNDLEPEPDGLASVTAGT